MGKRYRKMSKEVGLMLVMSVIKSECEKIAGIKDAKNPHRKAFWWGSQPGSIYYGKQKVLIDRPRLRSKDNKEIQLNTYKAFQNPKGMNSAVMKHLILGISSRNYEEAVEGFIKGYGIWSFWAFKKDPFNHKPYRVLLLCNPHCY